MAETEAKQNAQYEKDVEKYNQNLNRQVPNVLQNQTAPENQTLSDVRAAVEIPKDESKTAVID